MCFFFTTTPPPDIYTLSLHDALPIWAPAPPTKPRSSHPARCTVRARRCDDVMGRSGEGRCNLPEHPGRHKPRRGRSEEHTSELQSRRDLVCRLLLEKKKKKVANVDVQ